MTPSTVTARPPRTARAIAPAMLLALSLPAFAGDFIPAPKLPAPVPAAAIDKPAAAVEKPATPSASVAVPARPGTDANGWLRLIDGSNLACDPNHPGHPQDMLLNNGMHLSQEDWEGYLKPFISSLPPSKRAVVLDALTRFQTEYDAATDVIRFDPPPERDYQGQSWVSAVGAISLKEKKITAALMISVFGDTPLRANRIKAMTDDAPWAFARLQFHEERDPPHLLEYTYLPLAEEAHYNLARAITRAKQASVRVYGDPFYADIAISDAMRKDLHTLLMALDAINSLSAPQGVDIR